MNYCCDENAAAQITGQLRSQQPSRCGTKVTSDSSGERGAQILTPASDQARISAPSLTRQLLKIAFVSTCRKGGYSGRFRSRNFNRKSGAASNSSSGAGCCIIIELSLAALLPRERALLAFFAHARPEEINQRRLKKFYNGSLLTLARRLPNTQTGD